MGPQPTFQAFGLTPQASAMRLKAIDPALSGPSVFDFCLRAIAAGVLSSAFAIFTDSGDFRMLFAHHFRLSLVCSLVAVLLVVGGRTPVHAAGQTAAQIAEARMNAILDEADQTGDFEKAAGEFDQLWPRVVAYLSPFDVDTITDVDFASRLTTAMKMYEGDDKAELFKFLRTHDELARTIMFVWEPQSDDVTTMFKLLNRLRQSHGDDKVADYAQLTAALLVVHDTPGKAFDRRINENVPKSPDPSALFSYYVDNEKKLNFGVKKVPAELLVYVVDTTASPKEMQWALNLYRGDQQIGKHFFDIEYDYAHLQTGRPKKVSQLGFTLQNIKQYGGVCADQAYYAMTCGKAIGVPTVYTTARASDLGHAWVGYLEARGRNAWWNFNEGRYPEYQGIRGTIISPQTHQGISDSEVGLLAEMIGSSTQDRQQAEALTDVASTLMRVIDNKGEGWPPATLVEPAEGASPPQANKADAAEVMDFLAAAQKRFMGYAPAWLLVSKLGSAGMLNSTQRRHYADYAVKNFGRQYPDFMVEVAAGIISGIDDTKEQNALWEKLFTIVQRSRKDLAAEIRMRQAKLWEAAGDERKAGMCYEDIVNRFINDGPFALQAVQKVEEKLVSVGKQDMVIKLYKEAWAKLPQPRGAAAAFLRHSNWYQLGKAYASKLRDAGDTAEAARVEGSLGHM